MSTPKIDVVIDQRVQPNDPLVGGDRWYDPDFEVEGSPDPLESASVS